MTTGLHFYRYQNPSGHMYFYLDQSPSGHLYFYLDQSAFLTYFQVVTCMVDVVSTRQNFDLISLFFYDGAIQGYLFVYRTALENLSLPSIFHWSIKYKKSQLNKNVFKETAVNTSYTLNFCDLAINYLLLWSVTE